MRYSPMNDLIARKVFSSNKNKAIVRGMLKDFFGSQVDTTEITFADPYTIQSYRKKQQRLLAEEAESKKTGKQQPKQTIVDFAVKLRDARFIMEFQMAKQAHFFERSRLYHAQELAKGYSEEDYAHLEPVYSLNVLSKTYIEDEKAYHRFQWYDPLLNMPIPTLLEKYTGKVSKIGYFEYNKGTKNTGNLRHWQRLFQTGEAADDAPDYIKKAAEAMK